MVCVSVCLSVCPSVSVYVRVSVCVSVCMTVFLCVCLCLYIVNRNRNVTSRKDWVDTHIFERSSTLSVYASLIFVI